MRKSLLALSIALLTGTTSLPTSAWAMDKDEGKSLIVRASGAATLAVVPDEATEPVAAATPLLTYLSKPNTAIEEGYFGMLPPEIAMLILQKLDNPRDIITLLQVSQRMQGLARDPRISLKMHFSSSDAFEQMFSSKTFERAQISTLDLLDPMQAQLARIGELPRLLALGLVRMDATDISALTDLTNLSTLTLTFRESVPDFSTLTDWNNLGTLKWIFRASIPDISALTGLTNLHNLDLSGCSSVTADSILVLVKALALNLRSLCLDSTEVSPDSLFVLTKAPHLHTLSVGNCRESIADSVIALQQNSSLKSLRLTMSKWATEAFFMALAQNRNLHSLELAMCHLTEAAVMALAQSPNLRSLDLSCCKGITDAGVMALAQNPNLHLLSVEGSQGLTKAGIRALKQARPDLKIKH